MVFYPSVLVRTCAFGYFVRMSLSLPRSTIDSNGRIKQSSSIKSLSVLWSRMTKTSFKSCVCFIGVFPLLKWLLYNAARDKDLFASIPLTAIYYTFLERDSRDKGREYQRALAVVH